MNAPAQDDALMLDRLVDGELNSDQRRDLLKKFDEEADGRGWRRCALAFLEAQAWGQDFKALNFEVQSNSVTQPQILASAAANTQTRRSHISRLNTLFAMAASFLMAFGVALVWRSGVWQQPSGPAPLPGSGSLAVQAPLETSGKSFTVAQDSASPGEPTSSGRAAAVGIEAPTLAAAGEPYEAEELLQPRAPVRDIVPTEVLQLMKQMGYRAEQRRQLVPVQTKGGGELLVPVDRVEFRYVGDAYQ